MSNNSATDSSMNRNNSAVQKFLKPSLSRKLHSYQVCDPPVTANCSNENETTLQAHLVTQVHVCTPQDTNRWIQTKQFTRGQILKDVTNTINHTKEVHVDDSSVTSTDSQAKNPLPQGQSCTPALFDCDSTTTTKFKSVLSWKQLTIPLQTVLPNDPKYTCD